MTQSSVLPKCHFFCCFYYFLIRFCLHEIEQFSGCWNQHGYLRAVECLELSNDDWSKSRAFLPFTLWLMKETENFISGNWIKNRYMISLLSPRFSHIPTWIPINCYEGANNVDSFFCFCCCLFPFFFFFLSFLRD